MFSLFSTIYRFLFLHPLLNVLCITTVIFSTTYANNVLRNAPAHNSVLEFSVTSLSTRQTSRPFGSLTGDRCDTSTKCDTPRKCVSLRTFEGPFPYDCNAADSAEYGCICLLAETTACFGDAACVEGERCVVRTILSFCASNAFVNYANSIDPGRYRAVSKPNPNAGSLTYERCGNNADCLAPRACLRSGTPFSEICTYNARRLDCFCIPPTFKYCRADLHCIKGEWCRVPSPRFFGFGGLCLSRRGAIDSIAFDPSSLPPGVLPIPTNAPLNPFLIEAGTNHSVPTPGASSSPFMQSPEPSSTDTAVAAHFSPEAEICIHVKHLAHLQPHQLVYQRNMHAWVLCDKLQNCATPGHIVRYRGHGMMMKSYCNVVEGGCERSVGMVNSPAGWRVAVESWRGDMQFSSLAARWGTSLEEKLLGTLIRAAA